MRIATTTALTAILLSLAGTSGPDVRCEPIQLKPVRCVRGKVVNQLDEAVPQTTVTILKDGKEIATVETGQDGRFSFDGLPAGRYDIDARAIG